MDINNIIKYKIKDNLIQFKIGDEVLIYRRKGKRGYPKSIEDNVVYTIRNIENDFLIIAKHSNDGIGWMTPIKIHKTYMISKNIIRDIKLDIILNK